MMTCTSDRSGSASSGVRSSDQTPHAASDQRREQHQEAVGDRPADERGDHLRWLRELAIDRRLAVRPARRNSNVDRIADFDAAAAPARRRLESHRHRPPLQRRDRAVRERDLVLVDRLDLAVAVMRASARRPRVGAARPCASPRLQARFRVDQELARDARPSARPASPCGSRSGRRSRCRPRRRPARTCRRPARRSRRCACRSGSPLRSAPAALPCALPARTARWRTCRASAGRRGLASSTRALSVRVAAFTSGRIALHLALERLAGQRRRARLDGIARAHLRGLRSPAPRRSPRPCDRPLMRNSGAPGHHRHALARASSPTTPPIGAVSVRRALHLAARLDRADLLVAHAGEAHALPRAVDEPVEAACRCADALAPTGIPPAPRPSREHRARPAAGPCAPGRAARARAGARRSRWRAPARPPRRARCRRRCRPPRRRRRACPASTSAVRTPRFCCTRGLIADRRLRRRRSSA